MKRTLETWISLDAWDFDQEKDLSELLLGVATS